MKIKNKNQETVNRFLFLYNLHSTQTLLFKLGTVLGFDIENRDLKSTYKKIIN